MDTQTRYSDRLLLEYLKAVQPEKFKERRQVEHDVSPQMRALMAAWDSSPPARETDAVEPPPWEDAAQPLAEEQEDSDDGC